MYVYVEAPGIAEMHVHARRLQNKRGIYKALASHENVSSVSIYIAR